MKISALIIGFAGFVAACAIAPARAEDLTAGKTPAQLFRSDCGACHRSPNGLVKERGNVSGVADFLREHYTTNTDSAAALAAYVSGLASPGGSARNRGERRARDDGDMPRPPREVTSSPRRSSDLDSESASGQAARTGAPKRKRQGGTDERAANPSAASRTNAEAPADAEPKPGAAGPAETPQGGPQ